MNAEAMLAFRPLEEADLPLLAAWLAEPQVREWYRSSGSPPEDPPPSA